MGDDIWTKLSDDSFDTAYPMDPFNIKDFHSVDNAVIEKLPKAFSDNL